MEQRVGLGYDIHRLQEGRPLFIGGVEIPYIRGLLGHSDGDVLLHAICDALLGALSQGDIGELFPDSDPAFHNIASSILLKKVDDLLHRKNFSIVNIDIVVIAQEPKISPFKKEMQENIARILGIENHRVNIKAKTQEGLGEIGRKEAVACFAVAAIVREG